MPSLNLTPQQLAEQVNHLFTLPDIALRINSLLKHKSTTQADLEAVIENDPALAAQLLKLVNSSYYGFPQKIDNLARAITIIGHKDLQILIMATAVVKTFKGIPESLVDMNTFWFHSVTCAVIARLLAKQLKITNNERFFIAGLLHSIGKMMFFTQYPAQSTEILKIKERGVKAIQQAEIDTFGFTYAEAGAALLEKWQLPQSIWKMIAHHLQPLDSDGSVEDACLLNVAADMTDKLEPCAKVDLGIEEPDIDFNKPAYRYLQLHTEQTSEIIQDAIFESFEILSILRPEAAQIF